LVKSLKVFAALPLNNITATQTEENNMFKLVAKLLKTDKKPVRRPVARVSIPTTGAFDHTCTKSQEAAANLLLTEESKNWEVM